MNKIKKISAFFIGIILCLTLICPMQVNAEEYVPYDMRTSTEVKSNEEKQLLKEQAYLMDVQSNEWENWPEAPSTYGEAAIVMEAESGAVLYAKNIDGQGYPASITKVLTLLVALENYNMEDTVTVTQEAIDGLRGGYAHIGLKPGEEVKVEDILYAVMLASANEAAHSLASSYSDGYELFIEKMNQKVKELGGSRSNFVNTNGLHNEEHYTTVKEMALVTRELLLYHPQFEEICQTMQYTIGSTNLTTDSRTFQQKHKMMLESSDYYDARVIAGKTGYTDYALNTLITCAEDENLKLIVVNLKTYEGALYPDTENLLNYGFDNFDKINITKDDIETEVLSIPSDSYVVVPKGVELSDLEQEVVSEEDGKAVIRYTYNGQIVGDINVSVEQETQIVEENVDDELEKTFPIIKIVVGILIGLALLVVLYMMLVIYVRYKRKKERQRRRAMKRRRMMEMEREHRRQMAIEEERERRRQEYYRRNRRK